MHRRHYHFGDAAPVVVSPPMSPANPAPTAAPTVTGHIANTVHLVTRPVKWGVHTAGSLLAWAGNTLNSFSNKF